MISYRHIFTVFLVCSLSISTYAQVTIGSSIQTLDGALLDLKENSNTGANSTKGLLLPRVSLKAVNAFIQVNNPTDEILKSHIGLMVYNISEADGLCPGIYAWDGTTWNALTPIDAMDKALDSSSFDPATGILIDRDGEKYHTNEFGSAGIWMTQNLRTRTYIKCGKKIHLPINGTPDNPDSDFIRQVAFPGVRNSATNATDSTFFKSNKHLGLYYNWSAVTNRINASDDEANQEVQVQGICPKGWHVPTNSEWEKLYEEIVKNTSKYSSTPDIGTVEPGESFGKTYKNAALPMMAKELYIPNSTQIKAGTSKSAEEGGFNAYPMGYVSSGTIQSADPTFLYADYWIGTNKSAILSYYSYLNPISNVAFTKAVWNKRNLFNMRCKKDN